MPRLAEIVPYLDRYLEVQNFPDSPGAVNGLQIENSGRVRRIAAAVDGSTQTLQKAADRKADLLIVHHGFFWSGLQPITGILARQIRFAFENDIAVYAAHLPLDAHPVVGNNACLARAVGLKSLKPFLEYQGRCIGVRGLGRPRSKNWFEKQKRRSMAR